MSRNKPTTSLMADNKIFPFDISRQLGQVIQVAPSRVVVRVVQGNGQDLKVRSKASVSIGDYVVLGRLTYAIIGQVVEMRYAASEDTDFDLIINLFTSVSLDEMKVIPGVIQPARLGDAVFLPTRELVDFVISGSNTSEKKKRVEAITPQIVLNQQLEPTDCGAHAKNGAVMKERVLLPSQNFPPHTSVVAHFINNCTLYALKG